MVGDWIFWEWLLGTAFVFLLPFLGIWAVIYLWQVITRRGEETSESAKARQCYNQGVRHHKKREIEKAIAQYDQAIQLDPNHAQAYNNRSLAYQELGDKEKAATDSARAKELGYKPNP